MTIKTVYEDLKELWDEWRKDVKAKSLNAIIFFPVLLMFSMFYLCAYGFYRMVTVFDRGMEE